VGTVGVRAGGTCLVLLLAGCLLAGCATQGVFSDEELSVTAARLRAELADARASLEETEVWYNTPRNVSGPRGKDGLPSEHDWEAVSRWIKAVKEARSAMADWQRHNRGIACYYDVAGSAERAAARDAFARANYVDDRALYDTLCDDSSVDSMVERYRESTWGLERNTIRNMGLYLRPWVLAMSALAKAAEANHGRYLLVKEKIAGLTGLYILQQAKSASVVAAEKEALDSLAFARRTRGDPHGVERAERDAAGRPPLPPWPAPLPKKG
jgi:hypothetical protein